MPIHSSCRICGRTLSNPASIAVSMGPVCSKRYGLIFEEALAYARSIGAQLDHGRLESQSIMAAQEAYRERIRRRRNQEPAPANVPQDAQVSNCWSAARGQYESMQVEFSSREHAIVRSQSGHAYEVTEGSCTCPHFRHRLRENGEQCRHIEAFRAARNQIQALPPVSEDERRRAVIERIVEQSRHIEALRRLADIDMNNEEEREAILDTWRRNRAFDGNFVHEDDEKWSQLVERAKEDWEYRYDNVLGGTGNSFGMEIEFAIPHGVNKQDVARALYEEGVLDSPQFSGYHSGRAGPGFWKLETDSSIRPQGLELISPILFDRPETWQQIERACNRLKAMGCTTNSSCGGHIHVGVAPLDHRTYSWQRLARIGLAYERMFYRMGGANADEFARSGRPGEHRGTHYAQPLNEQARTIRDGHTAAYARQKLSSSRFQIFNATNVDASRGRKPTLEMRYPNSTLNPKQWQAQIQVANAVVHQAAVIRNESPLSRMTPGLSRVDEQLRHGDRCSQDVEEDNFRKFLDVLGHDSERHAATWLYLRGRV